MHLSVVFLPEILPFKVRFEFAVVVVIEGYLSPFKLLPCAGRCSFRDGEIDIPRWYRIIPFVVEYGLEWRNHLRVKDISGEVNNR
jgi:hypothetical protein